MRPANRRGPHRPCEGSQHILFGTKTLDANRVLIAPARVRNRPNAAFSSASARAVLIAPARIRNASPAATASSAECQVLIAPARVRNGSWTRLLWVGYGPHRPCERSQRDQRAESEIVGRRRLRGVEWNNVTSALQRIAADHARQGMERQRKLASS